MRVLVEIMDKDPIANVLGACIFSPEIVVFLCDKREALFVKEAAIYRLLRRRKLKTRPRFLYFNAASPEKTRDVLAAVLRDYPGCVFDFTGGKDLVLLQAGAYCLPLGVPGYYVDLPTGRFINVQHCAHLEKEFCIPSFSAEDVFALTGAAIQGSGHFEREELSEQGFEDAALDVWKIVQANPRAWGEFVAYLQAVASKTPMAVLEAAGPLTLKSGRHPARYQPAIFQKLLRLGVLSRYNESGKQVSFTFKNVLYKKCLLNQGVWLELFCYVTAKRSGLFGDVRTSVVVDWDGLHREVESTKNEVDVVLVKGITPVFVSCKMSVPTPLALSEIRVLSDKFGGAITRTVMLTADVLGKECHALKTRAKDLDILLLDRAVMESGRLAEMLERAAWGRSTLDGISAPTVRQKPE